MLRQRYPLLLGLVVALPVMVVALLGIQRVRLRLNGIFCIYVLCYTLRTVIKGYANLLEQYLS